jgi:hypothetical protein
MLASCSTCSSTLKIAADVPTKLRLALAILIGVIFQKSELFVVTEFTF